jgi:hypothetical protein
MVKTIFSWVYSLLGSWWAVALLAIIDIYVIGLFSLFMIATTLLVALAVWVKGGKGRGDKVQEAFNSAILHIKNWWGLNPF